MNITVCDICGKKFTYQEKLLAVWVSRMSVECCGVVRVPTFLSYAIFYSLLFASIIFAFYFSPFVYLGIMLAWILALSFLAPLFMHYKLQRRYAAGDSLTRRFLSKYTWDALIGYIYSIIVFNILNYLTYQGAGFSITTILVSAGALAVFIVITFVFTGIRVLLQNKRKPSDLD